jgi:hypothetical protein
MQTASTQPAARFQRDVLKQVQRMPIGSSSSLAAAATDGAA